MKPRRIVITESDRSRLEELIDVADAFGGRNRKDLPLLRQELDRAIIVASEEIRRDVVTMNSKVLLRDLDSREEMTVSLVFPKDADADKGAVSVLAPIGTAILGYAEGDEIEWPVPAGIRRLRIQKILYQPEAAGHFHL